MTMRLTYTSREHEVSIPLPENLAEAVGKQLDRIQNEQERDRFIAANLTMLVETLQRTFDADVRPPSTKQLEYINVLCRKTRIPIPREALIYRWAAHDYIAAARERFPGF